MLSRQLEELQHEKRSGQETLPSTPIEESPVLVRRRRGNRSRIRCLDIDFRVEQRYNAEEDGEDNLEAKEQLSSMRNLTDENNLLKHIINRAATSIADVLQVKRGQTTR